MPRESFEDVTLVESKNHAIALFTSLVFSLGLPRVAAGLSAGALFRSRPFCNAPANPCFFEQASTF